MTTWFYKTPLFQGADGNAMRVTLGLGGLIPYRDSVLELSGLPPSLKFNDPYGGVGSLDIMGPRSGIRSPESPKQPLSIRGNI